MGIFFEKRNALQDVNHPMWSGLLSQVRTKSGTSVTEETSIKYLTVFACVSLLAGDIASLPLILYKRTGSGKSRAPDHPGYSLAHDAPNPEMSSYSWREAGQGHGCLWGNHYSLKEYDRYTGRVKRLWPINNPGGMEIKRDEKNRLVYSWRDDKNVTYTRFKKDIFHVPGFSFDGVRGVSNIAVAREAIGMGIALDEFGARFFGQGMNMAGIIPLEQNLGDQKDAYLASLKKQYAGLAKSHGMLVLQNGEKYQQLSMPMEDAQFIESKKFQKIEICSLFHIPPHKIGIYEKNTNRSNTEQENQSYVDTALMHWLRRWEFALNLQVLTDEDRRAGYYYEFLLDALLRGDSVARSEYYAKRWQVGSLSANDIRAKENENPIEGGEKYFVPVNYVPLDQAGKVIPDASTDKT